MSFTGQLGLDKSQLGSFVLGITTTIDQVEATDAPTISESATRTLSAQRTTTESPTLSENVSIVSVVGDVTFENLVLSEAITQTFIGSRVTTEAVVFSEDVIGVVSAPRTTTDTTVISENLVRIGDFIRNPTDTPSISEATDWVAILSRTSTEEVLFSEVAVASKTYIRTATDTPTISESVIAIKAFGQLATDAPTISESVTAVKIVNKSLSQLLTITQSILVATPIQSVEQGLALSQSVSVVTELSKSASNTLTFSQSADYSQFKPTDADNTLTITQSVDVVQTTGVGNELTITQDVAIQYDPHLDQQFQVLVPAQTVAIAAIFNRTIEHTVALAQSVAFVKIIEISAANTLTVLQSLIGGPLRNAHNELTDLDQEVVREVYRNKSLNQTLAVTQSVGLQMILNRSLVSTLEFKEEHPVPDGAGGIIQVPNLIVTFGGKTYDLECCPIPSGSTVYQSATRAIVLPNPEFSDTEANVAAVSIKRTITGYTYSYVKKSANRKLKYKFIVNQRKAYELRRFLLDFLGDRLTLTNFHGELWSGYLLTDPAEIVSSSRGGICNGDMYEVELEFQGVRVN